MFRSVPMSSMIVAVDVDEVLGRYLSHYIDFMKGRYDKKTLQLSDFYTYAFGGVLKYTEEETERTIREFHASTYFTDIQEVPGSQETLKELHRCGVTLHVVTSRQTAIEQITKDWVKKHYGDLFAGIHVLNHFGFEGEPGPPKHVKCDEIKARLLIDDSLSNCTGMANNNKRALLFDLNGEYGWNKTKEPLPEGVKRVTSWSQVVDEVKKLLPVSESA